MQHIPYRGSGQMLPDLLGGNLPTAMDNIASAIPCMKACKPRALAVFAPAGMRPAIIGRRYTGITRILKTADMQKHFFDLDLDTSGMSPQELSALIKADVPRLGKVVKDSGARAD